MNTARDTHFQGFAKRLWDKIEDKLFDYRVLGNGNLIIPDAISSQSPHA